MTSGNSEVEDLKELEQYTRANAEKEIRELFARPDDLARIEQYCRKYAKRKENAEAQLKSAIQNQLDGVRSGLTLLQSSLNELRVCKHEVDEMDRVCGTLLGLHGKFDGLRRENNRYLQLASAIEHLKIISRVPDLAEQCANEISSGRLLDGHALLIEIESCRDSLIGDLHRQARIAKQASNSATAAAVAANSSADSWRPARVASDERTAILKYFESVDRLNDELFKQARVILEKGLNVLRREPQLLVSAMRIVVREERLDEAWARHFDEYGFKPDPRPKRWLRRAMDALERTATTRVSSTLMESRADERMWLTRHLELVRMNLLDDLRTAKYHAVPCFPPALNIFSKYLRWYHDALSKHLVALIEPTLKRVNTAPASVQKEAAPPPAPAPAPAPAAAASKPTAQNPFEVSNPFEAEMRAEQGRKASNPFDEGDAAHGSHTVDDDSLVNSFDSELNWEELIQLLAFVARYRSRELLAFPGLCTPEELASIGEVLPAEHISALETRYIDLLAARFTEWLSNALGKEVPDWYNKQEPAQLEGHFVTDLPATVIKILQEYYVLASRMYPPVLPRFSKLCCDALSKFCGDFKKQLGLYATRRKEDRATTTKQCSAPCYVEFLIAAVNNCDTFAQHSTDFGRQFADTIRESLSEQVVARISSSSRPVQVEQSGDQGQAKNLVEELAVSTAAKLQEVGRAFVELANQDIVGYLLTDLFADLAAPLSKLFSREEWLVRTAGENRPTEVIFWTLDDYRSLFVHLRPPFYRRVVQSIRAKLSTEYYRAFVSKKLLFKVYADRKAAADQVANDVKRLEEAISKYQVSPDASGANANAKSDRENWAQIVALSEVLRLEDPGMLSLELATISQKYPSVNAQDLRNVLTMRGDLPNKDINELVPLKN